MSPRFSRSTMTALVVALALAAVPACKKSKPTAPDTPNPTTGPAANPGPVPNPGAVAGGPREPGAPRSPVFTLTGPFTAVERGEVLKNIQQIGLAFHTFHDAMGRFPGGYYDKSGKVGLSWRVAILPYIEENDRFKQFNLEEPWDSENNRKLIADMPAVFAPGRKSTSSGYTFLRGFTGPNTWLNPPTAGRAGDPAFGVSMREITDGTSQTIVVAEAYDPVIWTKPDELAFAPNNPPRLGGVFEGGTNVLKADGSAAWLPKGTVDPKILANMIQINDGNPVKIGE